MNARRWLPWVVGALAVALIAVGGVFANLAVLESGEADAAIGTLSAKGIEGGTTWTLPATPIPVPRADPLLPDHHDEGAEHHDGDD